MQASKHNLLMVTMASADFMPGVHVLLQSMIEHSRLPEGLDFVVLTLGQIHPYDIQLLNTEYKYFNVVVVPAENIARLDFRGLNDAVREAQMQKLVVFRFTQEAKIEGDPRIVWIDSDHLCCGDMTDILDMQEFTAPPDWGFEPPADLEPIGLPGRKMFCAGFMVFHATEEHFTGITDMIQDDLGLVVNISPGGDQPAINKYWHTKHPDKINILPVQWDMSKRLLESAPDKYDLDKCALVHLVGNKPWLAPDKDIYADVEERWMSYFKRTKAVILW